MARFEFGGHSYELNVGKFVEQNLYYLVLIASGSLALRLLENLVKSVQKMQSMESEDEEKEKSE